MQTSSNTLPNILVERRKLQKQPLKLYSAHINPRSPIIELKSEPPYVDEFKQTTIYFGVTQQTLQLLLNYPFITEEMVDSFLDTEGGWFMKHNYWIKLRKKNNLKMDVSIKSCTTETRSTVTFYKQTMDIKLLKVYARNLREEAGEKQDFKLTVYAILNTCRYVFTLPNNSVIRIDVTRFANDDYYMIGSMDYIAFVECFAPVYKNIYATVFGPVRTKIVEYLSCYQEELYESLKLSVNQEFHSDHGLNRYYSNPIDENNEKTKEAENYFNLLGTQNKFVYFVAAKEEGKPLVDVLRRAYEYCESLVQEGIFKRKQ